MTEALKQVPDTELISAVRTGDVAAFGVLYERHLVAAKRAAACLANTPAEREDLVAEAFTRVLRMLRDGRGPDEEFRPYLLVTLRNTAINATTRGAPVSLYADVPETSPAVAADGPVIDRWDATVAADAFASLPERWRVVLWHTEVENESPATVAPMLGMRPNSVAALAYRAREGLRQAYLRMHVPEEPRRECRATVHKLAGYVRHSIPLPLSRKIDKHLTGCAECRRRVSALRTVNDELRVMLGPVVLGTALAAAYLQAPAVGGAVTGALSGAAGVLTGTVTGTTAGTTAGTLAGAVPALAASDAAAAVSSMLAVKATVVNVATALAIAAASTTVSAAAPAEPAPPAEAPAGVRVPAAGHGGAALSSADPAAPGASSSPSTSNPANPSSLPASTSASGGATAKPTGTDKAAAKQAKKEGKAARKAAKAAKKHGAAQDDGTATKPPKKSKEKAKKAKKDKKTKKPKKSKK